MGQVTRLPALPGLRTVRAHHGASVATTPLGATAVRSPVVGRVKENIDV